MAIIGLIAVVLGLSLVLDRALKSARAQKRKQDYLSAAARPCRQYLGDLRRLGYINRTMIDAT